MSLLDQLVPDANRPTPTAAAVNTAPTYEVLREDLLARLAGDRIESRDRAVVERLASDVVRAYQARAETGGGPRLSEPAAIVERLVRSVVGWGPFERFLHDRAIADEVMFNGDTISYVTADGRLVVDDQPTTEAELTAIVLRLLNDANATVDREHPIEVRQVLENRVRLSVSIPPVSDGLDGTMRIYRLVRTDLTQLMAWDALTPPAASLLAACMLATTGVLITGGPGSGKTTVASALLRAVPSTTNARIIQEVRELDASHVPGGRWSPDAGGHSIRSLVRRALQFAPGLVVVSETLGEEAFELLKAANAGCGFLTTLHANSGQLGMQSLVTAALMAGENIPERVVRTTFARLIDVVVHCEAEPLHRLRPGELRRRQVMSISVVPPQINGDEFTLEPVFVRDAIGRPLTFTGAGLGDELEQRLNRSLPNGVTVRDLCEGRRSLP